MTPSKCPLCSSIRGQGVRGAVFLDIARHPDASNRQVARPVDISSDTQISTLLARLAEAGLLLKRSARPGGPNAWSLTAEGRRVAEVLRSEPIRREPGLRDVRAPLEAGAPQARMTSTASNEEKSASWVTTAAPWRMAVAAIQVSWRRRRRPLDPSAEAIRAKQLAISGSTGSNG